MLIEVLALVIILVLFATLVYFIGNNSSNRIVVPSTHNSKPYLVQQNDDALSSANILSEVESRYQRLFQYLSENRDQYPEYIPYIDQLLRNSNKIKLTEADPNGRHTSYTVNKGEEIAICLRNKSGSIHDLNTIMYVVLHELSHVACPEIGHTKLFRKIFVFILQISIQLGIYDHVNYSSSPQSYCGITIKENLLSS